MSAGSVAAPRPVTPLGILGATLRQLSEDLDAVEGVPDIVRDRLRSARDLAIGLDPYVERCTTPASSALAALARRTAEEDWPAHDDGTGPALEQEMLSGHVEGQLLAFLVHATRATRVLEIGMFTGYSALAMAEALPDNGTVVACELDDHAADLARECFATSPVGGRITVEAGPALETLGRLQRLGHDPFDLVFVDADKAGYRGYVDALLDGDLLAPDALVVVDNTLMQGEPWLGTTSTNGRAIADFNAALTYDPRIAQVLLPVRDGVTLIRRV